jgi:hypothetical protein
MSSAHGAGLMLLPVLTSTPAPAGHDHGLHPGGALSAGLFVTGVHTLAMLTVAGVIAVAVYEIVGLAILRHAWLNLDQIWAVALIGAGTATLLTA